MSTRANVLIKDKHDELWFYRHQDGYPSCTAESLKTFVGWRLDGLLRANAGQAAGWLIILGAVEHSPYGTVPNHPYVSGCDVETYNYWSVGAYEPTTGEHGDIEYLYTINLSTNIVTVTDVYKSHSTPYSFIDFINHDFIKEGRA